MCVCVCVNLCFLNMYGLLVFGVIQQVYTNSLTTLDLMLSHYLPCLKRRTNTLHLYGYDKFKLKKCFFSTLIILNYNFIIFLSVKS